MFGRDISIVGWGVAGSGCGFKFLCVLYSVLSAYMGSKAVLVIVHVHE